MLKPKECSLCVLAGDMNGFVPDKLIEGAPVMAITMFPSQWESTKGTAREGLTVQDYEQQFEKYAGTVSKSYANVVRCRAQKGVKLPTGKKLREGALFCRQYDKIPESTKLVVFVGEDVAKHLRPDVPKPLTWRGFTLPERKENE